MAVTIKQIAELAGVGPTTVTLVLNNSAKISPETKNRVLRVIEEMDYVPNYTGKLLKQGRTDAVAVLSSYFQNIFMMEFVDGIERAIVGTKYQLRRFYSEKGKQGEKAREILYGSMADAVISMSFRPDDALLAKMRTAKQPLILVEDVVEGHAGIAYDNFAAGRQVVDYFASRGRRRIAIVVGATTYGGHSFSDDRLAGYRAALAPAGLDYEAVIDLPDYNIEDGRSVITRFLSMNPRPDALFFASGDLTAAGFLQAAIAAGLRIPDDVAVMGFDDSIIARSTTLGLSSVHQPILEMGRAAFELASLCISGEDPDAFTRIITFQPAITEREST
jgi:DNA-binding LacI/PurR family transcriptional regulator